MNTSSTITILGISLLLVYGLTKVLDFYGIRINMYGSYLSFYLFLLISVFILPNNYYKLNISRT
jgi:branched-subunit amino acid ABC-type transport system permease component